MGKPFYVGLPWEFFDAWLTDRRIRRTHVLTALYVAGRCFEAKNTGGGIAPVELSVLARLCRVSTETIRRTLHDLHDWGCLDFHAGDGGDPAWRIWLTGLSLDEGSARPLHTLPTKRPASVGRGLPTHAPEPTSASAHEERLSVPSTSPQNESAVRTNETNRTDKRTITEEKLDHLLGKATRPASLETPDDDLDSLPTWIAALPNPERSFLAELHDEFVVNGDGRWLDGDDGGDRR